MGLDSEAEEQGFSNRATMLQSLDTRKFSTTTGLQRRGTLDSIQQEITQAVIEEHMTEKSKAQEANQ